MAIPAWTANVSTSALVGRRELRRARLVGEVQVADRAALHGDRARRGSCASAGGSAGTRSVAGSTAMSGIRNERFSWMIRPRKPWPRGRAPIARPGLAAHPGRDEALDHAVRDRRSRGPRSAPRRGAGPGRRSPGGHRRRTAGRRWPGSPHRGRRRRRPLPLCRCAAAHARHGSSAWVRSQPLWAAWPGQCGPDGPWRAPSITRNLCE